jgi:NADH-quinone oxidoreductase subunit E
MDQAGMSKLEEILSRYGKDRTALLAMLQDIQEENNYLPRDWLEELCAELGIPMTKVYRVASFFKALSLEPRGKHILQVCVGTTCHVRGAPKLVDKIERDYGLKPGETTRDMKLTLETVGCVGACALGPLIVLDGTYYGHTTTDKLGKTMKKTVEK